MRKKILKKGVSIKKSKSTKLTKKIQQLEISIEEGYNQLHKAYKKALVDADKITARLSKSLAKEKTKSTRTKNKSRGRPPLKGSALTLKSLQAELESIKIEKATIQSGYKQLQAQQKALQLFAKEWAKKSKATTTVKKPKSISTKKAAKKETRPTIAPPEIMHPEEATQLAIN